MLYIPNQLLSFITRSFVLVIPIRFALIGLDSFLFAYRFVSV